MTSALLFGLGALGPVVFVAAVIFGAAITPGYNHVTDAVSALSQRGALEADKINSLFFVAAVLQMVLGWATIRQFGGERGRMAAAGWLILLYATMGALIAAFFPMDPIGADLTLPGILHLIFVGLSALALMAAMLLARHLPGIPWFSTFSLGMLAGMIAGGLLSALAASFAWPVLGVGERLTQLCYLIWLFAFALLGLRATGDRPRPG